MPLTAAFVVADESWQDRGVCRVEREPTSRFFPQRGQSIAEQRAMCARCPVKDECLAYALRTGEKFGVWGGTSERERRRMRVRDARERGATSNARVSAHGHAIRTLLADEQWHTLDELVDAATPFISSDQALRAVQAYERGHERPGPRDASRITDARGRRMLVAGLIGNMRKSGVEISGGRARWRVS